MTGTATSSGEPRPQRLAIIVPSPASYDSRTWRIASSVAQRGHDVVVHARAGGGTPVGETRMGGFTVVRVGTTAQRALPLPARVVDRALATRRQARGAASLDRGADLYHGMAFLGIPVALHLARLRHAPVVYDVRDLYADARSLARLPGIARGLVRTRERSWARRADAVVTVNDALAEILAERFGIDRPAVVMNCAPRWDPAGAPPRRLHTALDLAATSRIVLYHGGLEPGRGIEQLLAITPVLPQDVHVVLLGYGQLRAVLDARIHADATLRHRVHLLDAVPPEALIEWVASADVAVAAIQPTTPNHRLSTPNKLFEALAAGTPVVASDFPAMRAIVMDDPDGPLGAVCDPADPAAIGGAIRRVLDRDESSMADLRARCLRAAHVRYAWEAQLAVLLAVYSRLTGLPW